MFEQEFVIGLRMSVAAQDQGAAVGGRKVHIEHLDSSKFVQHSPWRQPGGERTQPGPQGDVQTVGDEGHKDVRFNSMLELVKNRPQRQVVLEVLKGRFDFD